MNALVGNAKSRKDASDARHLSAQGVRLAVAATVVLTLVAMLAGPLLISLASEAGAYRDSGLSHFYWLVLALPGFILAYTANSI